MVVFLPGEPFVETQLQIKEKTKAEFVFVCHLSNKYLGYLPKESAFVHGGHECNNLYTYWAKMAPGNMEKVVEKVVDEINKFY